MRKYLLFFIILLLPAMAVAEEAARPEPVEAVDLGEVVVRSEREASRDRTSAATVIVPEEDAPLATTTVQLLEQTVGVHVKRFGGVDDFSALSLRGSTPSQVQIYLDDVPLVTAQGTLTDLNLIPMSALDSVEVYRGGAPGTLPDSAVGGVVMLISKDRPDEFEWNINAGYGSFQTFRAGVSQAQPIGNFSYRFAYDYFRSEGDFTYLDNNGTTFNTNDDREVKRQNNAFVQNALFAKFAYDHPHGWRIEFIDSFFNKGQGIPGLGSRQSLDAHLTTWRNIAAINAEVPHMGTEHLDGTFNAFFDYGNSQFDDPLGEIGLGPQANDDDTYRFGEMAKLAYRWGSHQLISGMVAHRSEYYVPHVTQGAMTAGSRSDRHSINVGLEDEIYLWGERLVVVPSVRLENVFNHLRDDTTNFSNDSSDHQLSAKLGVKLKIVGGLSFRGNAYRGFRQPTFTELFGDRGALVGNPDLVPEEAINLDAGLVYRFEDNGWLEGARVEATYFRNDIDNLIQFLQTSQFNAKAFNLSHAVINGVELVARATFLDRLSVATNYTWQRAKDVSSNQTTAGKFLPGRPQHELGAMLIWRERWHDAFSTSLTAEYHYMSDMFLDTQNLLEVKDRSIITAGLGMTFFDRVTARFTARNISNDQTVDAVGYPLPGRSYWGAVEVKL